jgi:spore germination cell wall hydrolase CwlJ-like protein
VGGPLIAVMLCAALLFTSERQLDCLAKNVYYESAVESDRGKLAVAQVTLNRLNDGRWGDTICEVVHRDGQFSWTDAKKKKRPSGERWYASQRVALSAVLGNKMKNLSTASHYHNKSVKPVWTRRMRKVGKIGDHTFYEEKRR